MDLINKKINKDLFFKIIKMPARYWLICLILLIDITFLPSVVNGDYLISIVFIIFISLPIIGLFKQNSWANIYLWLVIVSFCFMDLLAFAFSGDYYNGSVIGAFAPFIEVTIVIIIMVVLNIKSFPHKK